MNDACRRKRRADDPKNRRPYNFRIP